MATQLSMDSGMGKIWVDKPKEALVLGCIMAFSTHRDVDLTGIREEYFGALQNRAVYTVIKNCMRQGYEPEPSVVWDQAVRMHLSFEIGDIEYLSECLKDAYSPSLLRPAVDHLKALWQRRELRNALTVARDTVTNTDDEISDVVEMLESNIYNIMSNDVDSEINKKDQVVSKVLDTTFTGILSMPSGFSPLDEYIGGFMPEDLIIVAGRPGMGKTAVALTSFMSICKDRPALFFQLDMGQLMFWHRILSFYSGIPLKRFRPVAGKPPVWTPSERAAIDKAAEMAKSDKALYETWPRYTVGMIRQQIRHQVMYRGVQAVFIDHIGKIIPSNTRESRERQVGHIAEELKRTAKEFKVPIVLLSQLNRGVDYRETVGGHKRPSLSDLRDSGAIEQEADIVLMTYRPEYYGLKTWEDASECTGQIAIQVEKNRNGETAEVRLQFKGDQTLVQEIQPPGSDQLF